jgi:hypothetical protein
MLASKNFEVESHHPTEIYEACTGLPEYDDLEYKDAELLILKDLNYCLHCPL